MSGRVRAFVLAACLPVVAGVAAPVPAWLRGAITQSSTAPATEADALVLLDESAIEFAGDGRRTVRVRQAVQIRAHEGRKRAVASIGYLEKSTRIKSFSAWLVDDMGQVRTFGPKETVHVAGSAALLYSEDKLALIDASDEARAGSTFGWEAETEERSTIAQDMRRLQSPMPVGLARHTIRVPKGWNIHAVMFNHEAVEPAADAGGLAWELRDIPAFPDEPFAPTYERLAAGLRCDITPAPGAKTRPLRSFATWSDLTAYAVELHGDGSARESALVAKARELCAGATGTNEKIRAIAGFVQQLRYIAVAVDLARGGGFKPRPAAEVLRCGYGDCKDKVALLRALLSAAGVTAHPVLCWSGDRGMVRPEWPSPWQFNHVVAAIVLDEGIESPFVVDDPAAGRLLLFDPTDRFTRFGDFPIHNQGGLVLICAPGQSALTRVPISAPAFNRLSRRVEMTLDAAGDARVRLADTACGHSAAAMRALFHDRPKAQATAEAWLKDLAPGGILERFAIDEEPGADPFEIRVEFAVPRLLRRLRHDLLTFKPASAARAAVPVLKDGTRVLPVIVPPISLEAEFVCTIPAGFTMTSPGATADRSESFGRFEAALSGDGDRILFRQRLELGPGELPPEGYGALRDFLEAARRQMDASVVLEAR